MSRDDEILDTLKKMLAAQEAGLAISRESLEISRDVHLRLQKTPVADVRRTMKFAKTFNLVMAAIVLTVIGYVIFKIESLQAEQARAGAASTSR